MNIQGRIFLRFNQPKKISVYGRKDNPWRREEKQKML